MAICSNKTRMVGSSRQMTKGASCIYRKRLLSFMLKSSCQPPRNRDSLDRFLLILISFQPEHISDCQARCISQAGGSGGCLNTAQGTQKEDIRWAKQKQVADCIRAVCNLHDFLRDAVAFTMLPNITNVLIFQALILVIVKLLRQCILQSPLIFRGSFRNEAIGCDPRLFIDDLVNGRHYRTGNRFADLRADRQLCSGVFRLHRFPDVAVDPLGYQANAQPQKTIAA